jgi:hypothetical protein
MKTFLIHNSDYGNPSPILWDSKKLGGTGPPPDPAPGDYVNDPSLMGADWAGSKAGEGILKEMGQ